MPTAMQRKNGGVALLAAIFFKTAEKWLAENGYVRVGGSDYEKVG